MQLLFAGSVTFSGQDIAYKITETDNKNINIEISILRGSNTNNQNNEKKVNFEFEKKENENKWILDKKSTKSDIDIFLEHEEEEEKRKWLLGTNNLENVGNIQLAFENSKLYIEKDNKEIFNLTDSGSAEIESKAINMNENHSKTKEIKIEVNIDKIKESLVKSNKLTGKHIGKVVDSLCNDFERTISEKIQKQTNNKSPMPREKPKILSR